MRVFLTTFLLLILSTNYAFSQEMLGISHSNYGGTNNLALNPSTIVNPYLKWDVNILTVGLHIDNNYLYVPNSNVIRLMKPREDTNTDNPNGNFYQRFLNNRHKQGYLNLIVKGPSFMYNLDKKNAIGFHTAFRTGASIRGIRPELANMIYTGTLDVNLTEQEIYLPKFRVNAMSWGEIGFTYGRLLVDEDLYAVKIGGTVKYLQGFAGGYLINRGTGIGFNDSLLVVNGEVDADMGYTDVWSNVGNNAASINNYMNGKGAGMDIGITYESKKLLRSRYSDLAKKGRDVQYEWKVGASLLDVGMVRFNKNAYRYTMDQNYTIDTYSEDLVDEIIADTVQASRFNMGLPTALSLQGDYHFSDFIFVSATWVQRIPKRNAGIDRSNLLAVTPRFETRYFELAFPVVLYEYRYPRLGTAVRFGSFVIGSDKIGSILGRGNLTGTDIYFSLKLSGDYFKKKRVKPTKTKEANGQKPGKLLKSGKSKTNFSCFGF